MPFSSQPTRAPFEPVHLDFETRHVRRLEREAALGAAFGDRSSRRSCATGTRACRFELRPGRLCLAGPSRRAARSLQRRLGRGGLVRLQHAPRRGFRAARRRSAACSRNGTTRRSSAIRPASRRSPSAIAAAGSSSPAPTGASPRPSPTSATSSPASPDFPRGVWHDFVFRVFWSRHGTSEIEAWLDSEAPHRLARAARLRERGGGAVFQARRSIGRRPARSRSSPITTITAAGIPSPRSIRRCACDSACDGASPLRPWGEGRLRASDVRARVRDPAPNPSPQGGGRAALRASLCCRRRVATRIARSFARSASAWPGDFAASSRLPRDRLAREIASRRADRPSPKSSTGCSWSPPPKPSRPTSSSKMQPALRVYDAVWGGAALAAPTGSRRRSSSASRGSPRRISRPSSTRRCAGGSARRISSGRHRRAKPFARLTRRHGTPTTCWTSGSSGAPTRPRSA